MHMKMQALLLSVSKYKSTDSTVDTIIISCLNNNKTGLTVQIFEGNSIAPLNTEVCYHHI